MISERYHIVYFIGIGGIGMSALAQWFKKQGCRVSGYDKTATPLTRKLEAMGIPVHYKDSIALINPRILMSREKTLVVYTPAVPGDHKELNHLRDLGYTIKKRSEILGEITRDYFTIAVAGTHGKTTTSTMITHLLRQSDRNIISFLGGVSSNYNSNFIETDDGDEDTLCIVEADEFDRSFLRLHPDYEVITALDPDHLDIYGDESSLKASFEEFMGLVPDDGTRLINSSVKLSADPGGISYGIDKGDVRAANIHVENGAFVFDYESDGPDRQVIRELYLFQPGFHNVENAIAAIRVCLDMGVPADQIREALELYKGVKRRFEYILNTEKLVFVDDYAHHPVEIEAFLESLKFIYPSRKLTAVFQPHLYSRTRDFVDGFAKSLSKADEVFLLDIYPAREKPIPGITAELIFDKITCEKKILTNKSLLVDQLNKDSLELLATIGAGDIDTLVEPIKYKLAEA